MEETPRRLSDKEFVDLAAQEVRGHLDEGQRAILYNDDNIERFYTALITLKRDVEVQLVNHKSRSVKKQHELNEIGDDGTLWKEYQAGEVDWRARAIKFLTVVEEYIAHVKLRKRELHEEAIVLRESIRQHREEIEEEDASDADHRLWAKVAG